MCDHGGVGMLLKLFLGLMLLGMVVELSAFVMFLAYHAGEVAADELGLSRAGVSGGREGWAGSTRQRRLLLLTRTPAGAWQAASGSARSG